MANRIEVACKAGAIPEQAKLEHTAFSKWDLYSSKGNHAAILQVGKERNKLSKLVLLARSSSRFFSSEPIYHLS